MKRSYFKEHEKHQMVEMYLAGKNQVEIANHFQTYNTSIRRVLKTQGVKVLNYSERHRKISPDFFNDWSNPDIQYWLGVIASDGCITKGALIVETIDKEWMEDYRNFLNPEINITTTQPKRGNLLYRVACKVVGLTEELEKYGIIAKKSLQLDWKFPITSDFLRGVFDGDGCVSLVNKNNNVMIAICGGSLIFLEKLQIFLSINNINSSITQDTSLTRKNKLYYLNVNAYSEKIKFYHLLYNNSNFKLKRKFEKYSKIFNYNFTGVTLKRKVIVTKDNLVYEFESITKTAKFLNISLSYVSHILRQNIQPLKNITINYLKNE